MTEETKKIEVKVTVGDKEVRKDIHQDLKGWVIVNECGIGKWLGKPYGHAYEPRAFTGGRIHLDIAFELASPSRMPVFLNHVTQGAVAGTITGHNCDFVLGQESLHPVEIFQVSSIQYVDEMSDEMRAYLFNIIADLVLGPIDKTTKKRKKQRA
jgi:hypothetical protein